MDIAFFGGKHKGGVQGKTDKAPVIIAVEIRRKEVRDPGTKKIVQRALAGRLQLRKLPSKSAASVDKFTQDCIAPGAVITTGDGSEYTNLGSLGYAHQPVPVHHDRSKMHAWLPLVGIVKANLKAWMNGTFHGVRKQHLQAHLNEFMFRFNRQFYRALSFRTLLGLGAHNTGPTYGGLYDRDWVYRENPPGKRNCGPTGQAGKICRSIDRGQLNGDPIARARDPVARGSVWGAEGNLRPYRDPRYPRDTARPARVALSARAADPFSGWVPRDCDTGTAITSVRPSSEAGPG